MERNSRVTYSEPIPSDLNEAFGTAVFLPISIHPIPYFDTIAAAIHSIHSSFADSVSSLHVILLSPTLTFYKLVPPEYTKSRLGFGSQRGAPRYVTCLSLVIKNLSLVIKSYKAVIMICFISLCRQFVF